MAAKFTQLDTSISTEQSESPPIPLDIEINVEPTKKSWNWENLSPRYKALIFANFRTIFGSVYHGVAKEAMNSAGVHVFDLCFIRSFINFLVAIGTVTVNKKDIFKDPSL